jgi:dihydroorotate dehydrogenase (NAD+) catalytic subunit
MPKFDLAFSSPFMNAAGSLGFAPERREPVTFVSMGAFVTNPISRTARTPAHADRFMPYPGGALLHSGHPNPGLRRALQRYAAHWRRASLPILVHLLAENPADLANMVERLEGLEGVIGIELGLPPDCEPLAAQALVQAAAGELPLVVRLPLERAADLAQALAGGLVSAFSLGPPRGAIIDPQGNPLHGRLYGPAIFPQALAAVHKLAKSEIPVIGAGGIYRLVDAKAMLSAGAIAVQLDAVLWRRDWLAA